MSRFERPILVNVVVGILLAASCACGAQSAANPATVILTRLSAPIYPEIALTARVQGNVELVVNVRKDGSFESASMVSGPALLMRAALSSAEQSQFECENCFEDVTPYHLIYAYRINVPQNPCKAPVECGYSSSLRPTEFSQSANHITVTGHPSQTCICDYFKRVRSMKCLYLCKCGVD